MDLTAQDIHHKQFHDAWRGYSQEEVDDFLDRVAEVMDRVQHENIALRRRLGELEQQVTASREAEEMLKKTLVTAQQAAEEAIGKAKAKAQQLIAEAEARSRAEREETERRAAAAEAEVRRRSAEADRNYAARKRELDTAIDRLRAYESDLRQRLAAFLQQQMSALQQLGEPRGDQTPGPGQGRAQVAVSARPAAERHEASAGPVVVSSHPGAAAAPTEPTDPGMATPADQDVDSDEASPQRRGVRGLFWREDA